MEFEIFYMQIISLGLLVLAAHFGGRITRRFHLGDVIGQVLGGLLVGPILLFLIEHQFPAYGTALRSLHFLTFVFLSLIAFGIGDELNFRKLKALGRSSIIICLIQGVVTWILITATFYLLGFRPIIAFIIGSIGIATAPATTFVIMNKLDIGGRMREMLGAIVVIDDVIEVLIFSIFVQVAIITGNGGNFSIGKILFPVSSQFFLAVLLGLGIFYILKLTIRRKWLNPRPDRATASAILGPEFLSRLISEMPLPSVEIFVMVAGSVSLGVGLALHWHLPFLITAVAAGIFISNFYSTEVFKSLSIANATSMYTLVFFALIGANARIDSFHLVNLPLIGAYVLARGVGKIGGTWLGCRITGQEKRLIQCLPRLMLPQAGVAAVEAFFVATILGPAGEQILGVILPGLIVFELIGVLLSERALIRWRSWVTGGGALIGTEELIREKMEKERIPLIRLIDPDCVAVPLRVKSKGEALWFLIWTLKRTGYIQDPGEVLEILLERERQGGAPLAEGIAIPHGRLPELNRPAVAVGVLPPGEGIIFGGRGDIPVDIIFLVLSSSENPELHLQILASISRWLSDREARAALRQAPDSMAAVKIIEEYSHAGPA